MEGKFLDWENRKPDYVFGCMAQANQATGAKRRGWLAMSSVHIGRAGSGRPWLDKSEGQLWRHFFATFNRRGAAHVLVWFQR